MEGSRREDSSLKENKEIDQLPNMTEHIKVKTADRYYNGSGETTVKNQNYVENITNKKNEVLFNSRRNKKFYKKRK